MKVSKALKSLAGYVNESTGEERAYALCVFVDAALKEGTKDAENYCAQVLAYHLHDEDAHDDDDLEAEELRVTQEGRAFAKKVTVNFLLEVVGSFDRSIDQRLVRAIAANAIKLMRVERDGGIRRKLARLLASLGVPEEKIPSTLPALVAVSIWAGAVSLAA